MGTIHIRQLHTEDWQLYRSIRLIALTQNPDVFSSNYEKEANYTPERWQDNLRSPSGAVFGLFDGRHIIGVTGIFTWRGDDTGRTAILDMSFIDAAYRGQGHSKLFYGSRINWAKENGSFKTIRVSHRERNEASRKANQAFGFEYKTKEMTDWPDGTRDFEHIYELDLD
jgi:RimJ/RimL family protein N-acetyltransferase